MGYDQSRGGRSIQPGRDRGNPTDRRASRALAAAAIERGQPQYNNTNRPNTGIKGQIIFNTDDVELQYYDGTQWKTVTDGTSGTDGRDGDSGFKDTTPGDIDESAFIYWSLDLGPFSLIEALDRPNHAGQLLTVVVNTSSGGSAEYDASLSLSPHTIRDGGTDYDKFTLNDVGDHIMLQGTSVNSDLRWAVIKNNGCVLA